MRCSKVRVWKARYTRVKTPPKRGFSLRVSSIVVCSAGFVHRRGVARAALRLEVCRVIDRVGALGLVHFHRAAGRGTGRGGVGCHRLFGLRVAGRATTLIGLVLVDGGPGRRRVGLGESGRGHAQSKKRGCYEFHMHCDFLLGELCLLGLSTTTTAGHCSATAVDKIGGRSGAFDRKMPQRQTSDRVCQIVRSKSASDRVSFNRKTWAGRLLARRISPSIGSRKSASATRFRKADLSSFRPSRCS
ncbi:hypothetical protein RHECNPAF_14110035 [Rhizobium etli CNPAF512]|nr:hypothetical protein RHECNPAF_14110035 [Rhizobium etli CNPAF512]